MRLSSCVLSIVRASPSRISATQAQPGVADEGSEHTESPPTAAAPVHAPSVPAPDAESDSGSVSGVTIGEDPAEMTGADVPSVVKDEEKER